MAITNIKATNTWLKKKNEKQAISWKALTALNSTNDADIYVATTGTYGVDVHITPCRTRGFVLLLRNRAGSEATVYVKKGDNKSFANPSDLTLKVAAGVGSTTGLSDEFGYSAFVLDTAKFLHTEGARKGYISIVGAAATVDVAIIQLP